MNPNDLGKRILEYCTKYNVNPLVILEILEDQKVTPMIRGKAMEYNAFEKLKSVLPKAEWDVQKLNISGQPGGNLDEDISITHKRTGIRLKVESKSAVRGSARAKNSKSGSSTCFNVKCHRSRSNLKKASGSNDRYSIEDFDIVITNPENAIYQGKTVSDHLEVLHSAIVKDSIMKVYGVTSDKQLVDACREDWRFASPVDISENGFVKRTPKVKFEDDLIWKSVEEIGPILLGIVTRKNKRKRS